jgi:hypothetical protein
MAASAAGGAARRLVVFGGSGFVGCATAQEALARGLDVLCLSRSGAPPAAVASQPWARRATWAKADALQPDSYRQQLVGAEAVVISIGSPPLPFVDRAFQARARPRAQQTAARPSHSQASQRAVMFAPECKLRVCGVLTALWRDCVAQMRMNGETNVVAARTAKEAGVPQARGQALPKARAHAPRACTRHTLLTCVAAGALCRYVRRAFQ